MPSFPQQLVALEDCQENWEFIQSYIPKNFLTLAVPVTGGHKIAFGAGTITWPGGVPTSNGLVVAHGLGITPVTVVVTCGANAGLTAFPAIQAAGFGATNFTATAWTIDAQNPLNTATTAITWIAIG